MSYADSPEGTHNHPPRCCCRFAKGGDLPPFAICPGCPEHGDPEVMKPAVSPARATETDTRPDPQLIVVAVSRDDQRRLENGELVVKPDDTPGPVRLVQLYGSTTRVALTCTPYAEKLHDQLQAAGLTRAPRSGRDFDDEDRAELADLLGADMVRKLLADPEGDPT